jgi:tol-pal system protein YbgF
MLGTSIRFRFTERDSSHMLTRTIVAGAAVAAALSIAAPAGAAGLFDFGRSSQVDPQQVQDMQAQIQSLQATVASLTDQVNQLNAQVGQLQDILRTVGVGATAASSGTQPSSGPVSVAALPQLPATGGTSTTSPTAPLTIQQPSIAAITPPPASPTPSAGTGARIGTGSPPALTPSTPGAPLDLSGLANGTGAPAAVPGAAPTAPGAGAAPAPGAPVQTASLTPTGNSKADYDQAYSFITGGRYDLAETSFKSFLTAYPKDPQAGSAEYWLGESYFLRGKYSDAAAAFRTGYQQYPKSDKAPDTLLALGQSLAGMGQRDEACQIYAAGLKQYPALKQRLVTEQASAAC